MTAIPAVPSEPPLTGEAALSDAELASLESLRAATTEEPWAIWPDLKQYGLIAIGNAAGVLETELWTEGEAETVAHVYVEEDAALIVAAVNALPRLVASLRSAREELMSARAERVELIAERDQARADLSEDWHSASRCGERPCPGCIIEDLVEQKAAAEGALAGAEQAAADARRVIAEEIAQAINRRFDHLRPDWQGSMIATAQWCEGEARRIGSGEAPTIAPYDAVEALAADVPAAPVTTGDCASGCTEHATCRADVPAAADDHEHPGGYLSTACLHDLHEPECGAAQRARNDHSHPHCKYCGAKCVCPCHTGGQVERAERVHVDGCTLAADDPHHAGWCRLDAGVPAAGEAEVDHA